MSLIIGTALVTGALKGWLDRMMKPPLRPIREHTPVYAKTGVSHG